MIEEPLPDVIIGDENRAGAWIVYGWDTMPYPLFLSMNELTARQYAGKLGYHVFVKFWKFGDEFGSE